MSLRLIRACLAAALLLLSLSSLSAQGAPEPIQDALDALNAELGTALTLNDFFWEWSQQSYDDTSLGCPTEGETYEARSLIAYQFLFTWDGQVYDYRVSAARDIVRLCSVTSTEEAAATPTPDPEAPAVLTNSLCPLDEAARPVYMKTRLAAGMPARVTPGLPNNLRDAPTSQGAVLTEVPGGGTFTVLEGPSCDPTTEILWWRVDYAGTVGWTAEGRGGEFYLEPLPPTALAATRALITPEVFSALTPGSTINANVARALTVLPGGTIAAAGSAGSEGLFAYDPADLVTPPRLIDNGLSRITAAAVSPAEGFANAVVVGDSTGAVRFWTLTPDAPLLERFFLQGHAQAISALAFSPDGARIASVGGTALTGEVGLEDPEINRNAILIWDVDSTALAQVLRGHSQDAEQSVNALAFSPDSTRLASAGDDNSVRLWDPVGGAALAAFDAQAPVTALVWFNDGAQLAYTTRTGEVVLLNTAADSFSVITRLTVHSGEATALALSPDGQSLVSVGLDNRLVLFDSAQLLTDLSYTGVPIATAHADGIFNAAFSADGTLLMTLGADNTLRVYVVGATFG